MHADAALFVGIPGHGLSRWQDMWYWVWCGMLVLLNLLVQGGFAFFVQQTLTSNPWSESLAEVCVRACVRARVYARMRARMRALHECMQAWMRQCALMRVDARWCVRACVRIRVRTCVARARVNVC